MLSNLKIDIIATLTSIDFKSSPVDLAVRFGNRLPGDLFSEKIIEEHMVPMVSPSLLPEGGLSSPEDLKVFELIHDKSISLIKDDAPDWKDWFEQAGVKEDNPSRGVYFNQADHALQAAISGNGVVFGRLVLGLRDIIEGRLVVPFQHVIPTDLCFYFVHQLNPENEVAILSLKQWMSRNIEKDFDELGLEHIQQSWP